MADKNTLTKDIPQSEDVLLSDLRKIIDSARYNIATYVNTGICMTNWRVGKRIREDVLKNKRAEYGKQVVKRVADGLTALYGKGWSLKQVQHCLRSAEVFSEEEIVSATQRQLSWTHLKELMFVKDELARKFYLEMCWVEHWTTRELADKIDGQLFERTAISRKPEEVIKQELDTLHETRVLQPDMVFRSSYFLDMLGLPDAYSENDLETAIIDQIIDFMKELGNDFALVDRQKRITVDAVDYKMDLVFFHRALRRSIVIDLKLGKFKPEYEGQMLLYLRYLNKNERHPWEESPIGLILCSEGNTEHIEYLMLEDNSPIKVAQYYTQLPDKKLLSAKLHRAIAIAREKQKEGLVDK